MAYRIATIALVLLLSACSREKITDVGQPPKVEDEQERITITDRTGKVWDITHAVKRYGFEPDKFQYGLGPFSIRPLISPDFLSPGEPNYPGDQEAFLMIGADLFGVVRAYPIRIMSQYEVSNEKYNGHFVAVAY